MTGTSDQNTELSGKQVQLLKELLPGLKRVVILENPMNPAAVRTSEETKKAARDLGLQVKPLPVRSPDEIAEALEAVAVAKGEADALIVVHDPWMIEHRVQITQLALKKRLPTLSAGLLAEAGGLMTYGPDSAALFKRAAVFVDKILKGRTPADLPVEQPTKFELIINLKIANQIGLTIPPNVLARADKVIK